MVRHVLPHRRPGMAVPARARKLHPVAVKPQHDLPRAAQLHKFLENRRDGLLHPAVRVLLEHPAAGVDVAHGAVHPQLAPARLLLAGRLRALAEDVELVLIQAPLEAQEQPVIHPPCVVNRFLVDEQGVDDPAHFDELLPLARVAGEAGQLAGRDGPDLSQTHLGEQALEARASHVPARRLPEIGIDHLDLLPPMRLHALGHRILQALALEIVRDLVDTGLPDVDDRFALKVHRSDPLMHRGPPHRGPRPWRHPDRPSSRSTAALERRHDLRACPPDRDRTSAATGSAPRTAELPLHPLSSPLPLHRHRSSSAASVPVRVGDGYAFAEQPRQGRGSAHCFAPPPGTSRIPRQATSGSTDRTSLQL